MVWLGGECLFCIDCSDDRQHDCQSRFGGGTDGITYCGLRTDGGRCSDHRFLHVAQLLGNTETAIRDNRGYEVESGHCRVTNDSWVGCGPYWWAWNDNWNDRGAGRRSETPLETVP